MMDIVIDSLLRASQIALLAIGLTLVYSLLRFPNFAHVEFATLGAFAALFLSTVAGLPLVLATLLALLVAGVVSWLIDRSVFARLRGTTPILMMIASFGLGIALREGVRAIWGSSPPVLRSRPSGASALSRRDCHAGSAVGHRRGIYQHRAVLWLAQVHAPGHSHARHRG